MTCLEGSQGTTHSVRILTVKKVPKWFVGLNVEADFSGRVYQVFSFTFGCYSSGVLGFVVMLS